MFFRVKKMHWLFSNYHSLNHPQESHQEDLMSTNYKFINYIFHSLLLTLLKKHLSVQMEVSELVASPQEVQG